MLPLAVKALPLAFLSHITFKSSGADGTSASRRAFAEKLYLFSATVSVPAQILCAIILEWVQIRPTDRIPNYEVSYWQIWTVFYCRRRERDCAYRPVTRVRHVCVEHTAANKAVPRHTHGSLLMTTKDSWMRCSQLLGKVIVVQKARRR